MPEDKSTLSPAPDRQAASLSLSRRGFLQVIGITGALSGLGLPLAGHAAATAAMPPGATVGDSVSTRIKVNGIAHTLKADPRTTLLDALRSSAADRHQEGLRSRPVRCVHGACQRPAGERMPQPARHARR